MSDELSGTTVPAFVYAPHDPKPSDIQVVTPPEPSPTTEPAPEPAPAPAPEPTPEPEPIRPDWLGEVLAEPEPAPVPANYPAAPAAPQPAPVAVPTDPDAKLNSFVQNPDGYIGAMVAQAVEQIVEPLRRDMNSLGYGTSNMMNAQLRSVKANAAASIDRVYDTVFNKDPVFRTNKGVHDRVKQSMQGMMKDAIAKAERGDPNDLFVLSNMTDQQALASLAAIKSLVGVQPQAVATPITAPGMAVESVTAPVSTEEVQLSPDLEQVAARLSPAKARQLRQEYAKTMKRGDVSWND